MSRARELMKQYCLRSTSSECCVLISSTGFLVALAAITCQEHVCAVPHKPLPLGASTGHWLGWQPKMHAMLPPTDQLLHTCTPHQSPHGCLQSYLMCPGAASHDTAVGLLQLAMNCSNHFTAAAAAMVVLRPLPLEPFAFRKLLLTAVQRQHTGAVQFMTVNPAVLQHVDAPMLEAVLKCLVAVLFGTELCVDMLLHLPAAEQLSSVAVMQLLQAAAQRRADVWVSELCTVPAAQQLIGADVAQLLQAAVPVKHQGCGNARCVSHICRLRGVQQLSSDVVRGLIRVAVEHGGVVGNSAEPLRKLLPAAQQLSRDELTSLLQAALGPHDSCAHMR